MEFLFDNNKPIYKQLVDQLRLMIVTGVYSLGEKLPSVREFATMTRVNPNTIQRALMELEDEGFIITKRTTGKYICDDFKILENGRKKVVLEILDRCISEFDKLDISNDEVIEYIKKERKDR